MKRILTLLLALSLCILVSCKEEIPEKPIEEISVEEIPVEKEDESTEETPTEKADEPIEEVPAEPEIEESTEEIGEDVIMLPEANENTKVIKIDFPEDFPLEPYTEPELVSPEEFEWGEYLPFVKYVSYPYTQGGNNIESFAVLDKSTSTLTKGTALYNLLNNKYLVENKIESGIFNDRAFSIDDNPIVYDAFKNSHIIYISENIDKVSRFYIRESAESEEATDELYSLYNAHVEVIKNNEIIFEETKERVSLFETSISYGKYLDWQKYSYPEFKIKYRLPAESKGNIYYRDENFVLYTNFSSPSFYRTGEVPTTINWNLCSTNENGVILQINLPSIRYEENNKVYSLYGEIKQVVSENYYLIDFFKGVGNDVYGYDVSLSFATYLFDVLNNKLTLLEPFATNPCLSPNLKYLAYTDSNDADTVYYSENLENQKSGLYIKNLESSETVFFKNYNFCEALSWINKEKFYEAIRQ